MNFTFLKEKAKWWGLASGALFLVISAYMQKKFIFDSGNTAGLLLLVAMIAAVITLVLGILSLPKWQGFVALAIAAYAIYWLSFGRPYGLA
jgi:hypothetical protein